MASWLVLHKPLMVHIFCYTKVYGFMKEQFMLKGDHWHAMRRHKKKVAEMHSFLLVFLDALFSFTAPAYKSQ